MAEERLQKIIAHAGIASRRKAEELILEGRVKVNGRVVAELGAKADPAKDHIKVDNKLLRRPEGPVYLVLNKPKDCVTTLSDPQGRRTVMDLVKGVKERVYPVGRLDYHSEGLLLLTNDGEFAARAMAPATHLEKTYEVKVNGRLAEDQEARFRAGIPLHGLKTAPAKLRLIKPGANPWYEVKLTEGRTHQIKLMFRHFDRLVEKIRRTRIGFLTLQGLPPGRFRQLTAAEVSRFRKLLKMETR